MHEEQIQQNVSYEDMIDLMIPCLISLKNIIKPGIKTHFA